MIFESHAHYDDKAFDEDREALISSLPENGIKTIINVSSDLGSVERTIALSKQYDYIYGAIGIHPSDAAELNDEKFQWLKEKAMEEKMVAIGEIGLDYYWPEPDHEIQKEWFIKQLQLAKELNKPVIIHSRDAAADTLSIMEKEAADLKGVIHCYSYSKEMAKNFLKMGYYFGIGGVITFSNAKKLVETVEYVPLENILLETDCPYLAPVPNRGKRNSSLNLTYVAEKIAEIKGVPYDTVIDVTRKNANKLFFGKEEPWQI